MLLLMFCFRCFGFEVGFLLLLFILFWHYVMIVWQSKNNRKWKAKKKKASGVFVYIKGNCRNCFFAKFFLSVCEVIFSYICFGSAQFCWMKVSMWNSATQQTVNVLSVMISGVPYNLLDGHHCCILLLYWAETVLQYEQVCFITAELLEKIRK